MKTLANDNDVREIRGRMESLTADDSAVWGLMSAAEMVCHLRGAFAVGLGEKTATPVKSPLPAPVIKRLALWVPMRWPQNVPTVPELRKENAPSPKVFAEDLSGALAAMERFVSTKNNRTIHAIFGKMTPADWMRWGYLHTDHHLRQFGR